MRGSFLFLVCFLKEIRGKHISLLQLSCGNTSESLGELEKSVELLSPDSIPRSLMFHPCFQYKLIETQEMFLSFLISVLNIKRPRVMEPINRYSVMKSDFFKCPESTINGKSSFSILLFHPDN